MATLVFVLAMLVPVEGIIIAQFTTMRELGLNNTLIGVVLPGSIGAMNVLLMRNVTHWYHSSVTGTVAPEAGQQWYAPGHVELVKWTSTRSNRPGTEITDESAVATASLCMSSANPTAVDPRRFITLCSPTRDDRGRPTSSGTGRRSSRASA